MSSIKLTDKQLESIFHEDNSEYSMVVEGDWDDMGKYQMNEFIFKCNATGVLYEGTVERHGSYYSGYEMTSQLWGGDGNDHEVHPVVKVKRVVEQILYVGVPQENDIIL